MLNIDNNGSQSPLKNALKRSFCNFMNKRSSVRAAHIRIFNKNIPSKQIHFIHR